MFGLVMDILGWMRLTIVLIGGRTGHRKGNLLGRVKGGPDLSKVKTYLADNVVLAGHPELSSMWILAVDLQISFKI